MTRVRGTQITLGKAVAFDRNGGVAKKQKEGNLVDPWLVFMQCNACMHVCVNYNGWNWQRFLN